MTTLPTGKQFHISHGAMEAVVTEVGATLRSIRHEGRELLWTFEEDEASRDSQGAHLLPWPNRIADGRYSFDGVGHQLGINEVDRQTALHGLNAGFKWELVSHTAAAVTMRHTFHPEQGWPGVLTSTITHALTETGLEVTVRSSNDGAAPLPYGYGTHPYFAFEDIAEVELVLPFDRELLVDAERLLPQDLTQVTAGFDFRAPRHLGDTEFDTAFTGPTTSNWTVELRGPSHSVGVWGDASTPWVQVYTRPQRDAIAIEPMTCGPDAFNPGPTHADVVVLQPAQEHVTRWGVTAL